jgi:flagellin
MALSLANNVASLNAQNNINRTNTTLSRSLERLSTGLRINRGADSPSGLVISEQQRAQITGLRQAIDNTNKSVALVQTAEGALSEVSTLLNRIRSLALDSANSGVNDSNSLAANQAEIDNALATIDRIGTNTQFGTRKLFDGTAGFSGVANDAQVSLLKVSSAAVAGSNAVNISTAAERAFVNGGVTIGAGGIAADETLTLNGINIALTTGQTAAQVVTAVNNFTAQTGVVATNNSGVVEFRTQDFGASETITVSSNLGASSGVLSAASLTDTGVDIVGTIGSSASTTGSGNVLSANGITVRIAEASSGSTATVTGAQGTVVVSNNALSFQIGANSGQTTTFSFDQIASTSLGVGVNGNTFSNIGAIDVTTAAGAQSSLAVIDQAINDVSTLRGRLGAFQSNSLESNANNLRASLENTIAAESVIRDTDFAQEIADFTRSQVQLQAGSSVLGNANQIPQLVASLLRG